ncbi:MAG TPA: 50S ribosomal protein L18 [Candidatus Paceibacterota bacterium]|nr:50S ribosomal protein L18 [Candidatus Paceibacterota bacterium]
MSSPRTNKTPNSRQVRHVRVRAKISGTAERPRLSVFRSNKHIYAQLIDDVAGKTLAAAGDHEVKAAKSDFAKISVAQEVGAKLAEKAKGAKITKVVFDRSGYRYTGRIKAVAEGARAGGLEF